MSAKIESYGIAVDSVEGTSSSFFHRPLSFSVIPSEAAESRDLREAMLRRIFFTECRAPVTLPNTISLTIAAEFGAFAYAESVGTWRRGTQKMAVPRFGENHLRRICEVLTGAFSHRELSALLGQCSISERGGTPRWERAFLALSARQEEDRCGNNVAAFIQAAMEPVRFTEQGANFTEVCRQLNEVLSFSALQLGEDGKLHAVSAAQTLTEAERMAHRLRSELQRRGVHPDALVFCRAELLEATPPNYFHAVLEASKSVAQKLRDKTGLTADGAELVDPIFPIARPLLAINSLRTESEQSEHKGFANLLRGMFGTFRNPTGHAPKIVWRVTEQDALDLLSLVSYLHRRLDSAVRTTF